MGVLSKIYGQDGERDIQALLVNSKIRVVEETGYDNWNGGQWGHDVFLQAPEDLIVPFIRDKQSVQSKIRQDLNEIADVPDEFVSDVYLEIEDDQNSDWREQSGLLSGPQKRVSPTSEQRIWIPGLFRVFLSHKTEVKREVAQIKEDMLGYGASCFVAHEDIHPTQEWQAEIESALASADAFVAVLTKDFHDSFWTDQEVGYALARGIPIIALRLGRDPYGFIGKFQALNCTWESAPFEIMKILIKQDRMVAAYASSLEKVRSFNEANALADLLPHIERIGEESANLLVTAYNNNAEVRGAFAFNGGKPASYGAGLIGHLQRLGVVGYSLGASRLIEREKS